MRSEVSKKNPYWISKHRFYELKHFCLQYPEWEKVLREIQSIRSVDILKPSFRIDFNDPTSKSAEERLFYSRLIQLVDECANDTDTRLGVYILKGVTCGLSYDIIKAQLNIPCCKDTYYNLYRRFFWILSTRKKHALLC